MRDPVYRRLGVAAAMALTMRVLDLDGREVHSAVKGDVMAGTAPPNR
jgi:hypothetical protein